MKSLYRIVLFASVLAVTIVATTRAANLGPIGSASSDPTTNGNALRSALSSAQAGDAILLTAGAAFAGPFQLTQKSGASSSAYITIRTSTDDLSLPPNVRVSPASVSLMPTLVPAIGSTNSNDVVMSTGTSAGYYQLVGLEIATPRYLYNVVTLGTGSENSWQKLPTHITFDRCFIHGSYANGTRRGIAANAGQGTTINSGNSANSGSNPQDDIVITNSFFADFKDPGADSQAVAAWNGYGPFHFENNYFEAAGENVMFGGADPSIRYLVPSDIKILRNHFYKPLAWFNGSQAGKWWVKNIFELKNAQNVTIDSNVFEHNWVNQQNGMGILFTPRNQNGTANWSVVQNVTFTNNIVRHSAGGFNILGYDDIHRSKQLNHVTIHNNLLLDINSTGTWGSSNAAGRLFEVENQTDHVTVDHITGFQGTAVTYSWDQANTNFVFTNNVVQHNYCGSGNNCGMSGDSKSPGLLALNKYFVSPIVTRNLLYAGDADSYPLGNVVDSTGTDVTFNSDYTLATPQYFDNSNPPQVWGISSAVGTDTAPVVQVCTSNGVNCSTNP